MCVCYFRLYVANYFVCACIVGISLQLGQFFLSKVNKCILCWCVSELQMKERYDKGEQKGLVHIKKGLNRLHTELGVKRTGQRLVHRERVKENWNPYFIFSMMLVQYNKSSLKIHKNKKK